MARPLVILWFLPLLTASIDLSALVASHHGATLTPELLQKVKSLFPSASFNFEKDSGKLEKLLASLKPAEGRLDPAMIELLSSVDSGSKRVTRHRHQQSASADESQDRPKFSSKFRLTPSRSTAAPTTTEGPAAEKFIDPNIRNHRLFINDQEDSWSADSSDIYRPSHGQERFENYENFTTIDQIEDLMADESYPSVVVAVPVATTQRVTRNSSSMADTTTSKSVSHHRRRRPSRPPLTAKPISPVLRRPALLTTSTISSFEDFIPFESMESHHDQMEIPNDEDDFPLRHREPLNLGSTEKTAVFYPDDDNNNNNNYFSTSTEAMSDYSSTPHSFRPSPLDLSQSPPVYFVPGQDFYTTSLKNPGNNSPGNIKIVKTPKPKQRRRGSSSSSSKNHQSPSNHWQQGSGGADEGGNLESQPSRNSLAFIQPPKHFLTESHQQPPVLPSFLNPKSDRILQGPLASTYTYSGQHNSFPASSATFGNEHNNNKYNHNGLYASASDLRFAAAELNPYASSTTGYLPLADQNPAAAGQNYFAPNPSPHHQQQWQYANQPQQSYAPGTTFYYANPSTSDQQAHDSAHYPHHHGHGGGHYHGGETSSWTSTFFILGGLVALSGVIAFLLPSFLANAAGSVGGKDVDKIGQEETDLWSEIKALYNDIVHIAKGDFQSFIQNGPGVSGGYKDDLPKIHYEEVDDDDMPNRNSTNNSRPANDDSASEEQYEEDSPRPNAKPQKAPESSSSTSAGQDDDDFLSLEADDEVDENRVDARSRKSKGHTTITTSTLNYNPTLPYTTTFRTTNGIPGIPGVNFANAFNQTLNAWEAVPLIRT